MWTFEYQCAIQSIINLGYAMCSTQQSWSSQEEFCSSYYSHSQKSEKEPNMELPDCLQSAMHHSADSGLEFKPGKRKHL